MDALIRLDVVMPITPLMERTVSVSSTATNNFQNSAPQQTRMDDNHSLPLEEIGLPSVIDLTDSHEQGLNSDKETDNRSSISNHSVPIITIDETGRALSAGAGGAKHRAPAKHKLPPLSNDSPPKVSRGSVSSIGLSFTEMNRSGNFQSATMPGSSHEISGPFRSRPNTASSIMKNHTVTSADFNNELGLSYPSNMAGTSKESNIFKSGNRQNIPEILPGQSLSFNESNNFLHNGLLQNSALATATATAKTLQSKPIEQFATQIDDELSLDENKEKEPAIFYQLLDIFPDIDLEFLKTQCRLGLDINQISDIILDMADYPRAKFQTSEIVTPKLVINVNANSNYNISTPSTSSSSVCPILADEEIRPTIVCDNNLFVNRASDAKFLIPSTFTPINQEAATIQISDRKKEQAESTPVARDVQKENEGIQVLVSLDEDERKRNLLKEGNQEKSDNSVETKNIHNKYSFLMEIFPDADPAFLEQKSKLNETELRNFIAESMEKCDYPKVTATVKEEKEVVDESIDLGLYTTNFNIENFLKIFPDPFEYFLDEKRNCQFSDHAVGFLKRRYRFHAIKLILLKYKEFNYNLVKTCAFLEKEEPSRVTKRGLNEIRMPEGKDLPFLQEACFIEHQPEIKKYLDGIAEAKRLAFDQAEAKGELIECGCCYQNVLFEDCAACNEGHLFCKTCIRKGVEVRIGDAHTTFPCLIDCGSVFSLQLLEVLVDPTMFSRLLQRIQMDEVMAADIEGLECCPFCDFAIILPPDTNIFKCLNPECLKESCRKCHKLSHIPQRCEEVENDDQARARKYIEDEMTRALVRECYKCKKNFIKADGCNKMTCTCGAKMCYICREPIVDYKHFNGPGGENQQKCPLYSTEKVLHVDAVEAVAKKALEEVTSKNPELKLKHDPTKILPPAESAKTTLPPGVNEEAARLVNMLQHVQQMNEQIQRAQDRVEALRNTNMLPRARITFPYTRHLPEAGPAPQITIHNHPGTRSQGNRQNVRGGAVHVVAHARPSHRQNMREAAPHFVMEFQPNQQNMREATPHVYLQPQHNQQNMRGAAPHVHLQPQHNQQNMRGAAPHIVMEFQPNQQNMRGAAPHVHLQPQHNQQNIREATPHFAVEAGANPGRLVHQQIIHPVPRNISAHSRQHAHQYPPPDNRPHYP